MHPYSRITRAPHDQPGRRQAPWVGLALAGLSLLGGCATKPAPSAPEASPVSAGQPPASVPAPPPAPRPERVEEAAPVPMALTPDSDVSSAALADLNRHSPLAPVYFGYDSAELDNRARQVAQANAEQITRQATWTVTIEGHCDERGTAEYNLALGERRAEAVRAYLVSLGISPVRLRVVSYGKEFPFDPAHAEAAWAANRRAHFVITSK